MADNVNMKEIALYTFILFAVTGFAPQCLKDNTPPVVDKVFQRYVSGFLEDSGGLLHNNDFEKLSIKFKDLEFSKGGETIGQCTWSIFSHGPLDIVVDTTYWDQAGDLSRWALIYHELGHCVCNRRHTVEEEILLVKILDALGIRHRRHNLLPGKCPRSVMTPHVPSAACLNVYRARYVEEMFLHCLPSDLMD